MSGRVFTTRSFLALGVALASFVNVGSAGPPEEQFLRAYYLEHEQQDWVAAAELYQQVAEDKRADKALRAEARAKLESCHEELTARDFARLMPPEALAYVEINRPGEQITRLLGQLGLLAEADQVVQEGRRLVAISPALIDEAIGLGGIAVAVTGFDPRTQTPSGVVVMHPGNLEVIRALIETALPAGGQAVEPIGGYPTYDVEGEALVTLTKRLVIASTERSQIEGVLKRLNGGSKDSLATNAAVADLLGEKGNSLLTFFVNAKPILPMLKGAIQAEAARDPELAMVMTLLDIDSLNSLSGKVAVTDDGIAIETALRLDEGHRNLVFNLLRTPAINPDTLRRVPGGVAGMLAGALNEAGSRYRASSGDGNGPPPISFLDFGRELFANITSYAVFVLPPEEASGPPIPDVAVVLTVNDPAKSEALWTQMLGIANMVGGGNGMIVEPVDLGGAAVRRYRLPEGVTLHFATLGNDVVIASSDYAIKQTIAAGKGGGSIVKDAGFVSALGRVNEDTTEVVMVHAGRAVQVAKRFMSPGEVQEIAPFLPLLSNTTASFIVDHSDNTFRLSLSLAGIPDVGDLVSEQLTQEVRRNEKRHHLTKAMKSGSWEKALAEVNAQLAESPDSPKLLQAKFRIEATGLKDREGALATADAVYEETKGDANALNTIAWGLMTEKQYGKAYDDVALKFSRRSNELTKHRSWAFVDTLALAEFRSGDVATAVAMQQKAIDLCGTCGGLDELSERLAKFEKAAPKDAVVRNGGTE